MLKAFDFCIPTRSTSVPTGRDRFHEVKYHGLSLWGCPRLDCRERNRVDDIVH